MEFSFTSSNQANRAKTLSSASASGATVNERLQKAIERNRAKQARRAAKLGGSTSVSSGRTAATSRLDSLRSELGRSTATTTTRTSSVLPRSAPQSIQEDVLVVPKKPTRRNVAVAGKASFTQTTPKKSLKQAAPIRYLGLGKKSTTGRKKGKKLLDHIVLFGWICMAILGMRLLFSERGIVDYYRHKSILATIAHETNQVRGENRELLKEIDLIQHSSRYQKKIVRDYLGFIAKNEYLILFAKGRSVASTK